VAGEALDADVGTQPDYLPFITATGVLLLQMDDIVQSYFRNHLLF
jgi:hypothetical protein